MAALLDLLDANRTYMRIDGRGEPQLGRRGLYRAIAGQKEAGGASQMDLLWVLNLADGKHSLLAMADRAGVPFPRIRKAARLALEANYPDLRVFPITKYYLPGEGPKSRKTTGAHAASHIAAESAVDAAGNVFMDDAKQHFIAGLVAGGADGAGVLV